MNVCVKILLSYVHEGYLWLDRSVSIDTYLTMHITGLPSQGEDASLLFSDQKNEKDLSERMKDKFHMCKEQRGLDVVSI
jgi:hypothetical protein